MKASSLLIALSLLSVSGFASDKNIVDLTVSIANPNIVAGHQYRFFLSQYESTIIMPGNWAPLDDCKFSATASGTATCTIKDLDISQLDGSLYHGNRQYIPFSLSTLPPTYTDSDYLCFSKADRDSGSSFTKDQLVIKSGGWFHNRKATLTVKGCDPQKQ